MGSGFYIHCAQCGHGKGFPLGIGMLYDDIDLVKSLLSIGRRRKVEEILSNHRVKGMDYSHDIYACNKCQRAYGRFSFKIKYDKDLTYETIFKCPQCRGLLRQVDFLDEKEDVVLAELLSWPCPKCGKKGLEAQEMVLWE